MWQNGVRKQNRLQETMELIHRNKNGQRVEKAFHHWRVARVMKEREMLFSLRGNRRILCLRWDSWVKWVKNRKLLRRVFTHAVKCYYRPLLDATNASERYSSQFKMLYEAIISLKRNMYTSKQRKKNREGNLIAQEYSRARVYRQVPFFFF